MFVRLSPVRDPVTLTFDGKSVVAERGEPLAVALLASGESVVARSPKLHRPRGPSCLRGDCDGCIARVDGVPNVMTCLRDARGGETVSAQNVLGSKKTDLLRITDWFFPRGIDHHHLMAGVPGVGTAMQTFARQMAGVGRLPDAPSPAREAERSEADVLVIGAGLAGLACARDLGAAGLEVLLVDEGTSVGGSARYAKDARDIVASLADLPASCDVRLRSTALGLYDSEALIADETHATLVRPRAIVIATGAHDGVLCAEGNDVPGVFGVRALCALASRKIVPDKGAVIVGDGPWAERLRQLLGKRVLATVEAAQVEAVEGTSRVRGVRTKGGDEIACGVVAVALPNAPVFLLGVQAGAKTRATDGGFALEVDEDGRAAESVWAAGECTGLSFDPAQLVESGARVARSVVASLGGQPSITASKSPKPPAVKMKPKRPIKVK